MFNTNNSRFSPPFTVYEPSQLTTPLVFNVPHSGSVYPEDFVANSRLNNVSLRRSEDAFLDHLYRPMTALGAPVLSAHFPRAYIDVNREPFELEPRLFEGKLPTYANTRSTRVLAGLGTIPRIVADGYEIYRGKLSIEEGLHRIETLYRPYHATLRALLDRTISSFGFAILIDCHSMPSASLPMTNGMKPDVVLGDRFGTSCSGHLIDIVEVLFAEQGYQVARNKPYAGGFITEFYGDPASGCHALQIELNRTLYMNEGLIEPLAEFSNIAGDVWQIFSQIVEIIGERNDETYVAAE
ncbi:N-formylglutamate amidohydrolase [Microvirga sp. W0021]|uniref:N-formylglutamate amidohydrolase n=1 Tax=Hohaiivirga grylli TaxID=3133970 RepID=A0ABV0BLI3_9HYPH